MEKGGRRGCKEGAKRAAAGTYRELARLVVNADVGDVHGVGRGGDGWAARRAQHVAHEGGEGALLLAVGLPALDAIAVVAVAVARALGGRWRGIHLAGQLLEGGGLAQARRLFEARGLAVGGLGVGRARGAELLGAVRGRGCAGDDGGEGVADEVVGGGEPARGGGVVEAVCAVCIDGAALGERREQRGRPAEGRGRVAVVGGWRDAKPSRVGRGVAARALEVGRGRGGSLQLACRAVLVVVADGGRRPLSCLLGQPPVGRLAVSLVHGRGLLELRGTESTERPQRPLSDVQAGAEACSE